MCKEKCSGLSFHQVTIKETGVHQYIQEGNDLQVYKWSVEAECVIEISIKANNLPSLNLFNSWMKYENADSKVQHVLDYAKETWIMDYLLAKKIYGLQASLKLVNKMSVSDASLLNMEKFKFSMDTIGIKSKNYLKIDLVG